MLSNKVKIDDLCLQRGQKSFHNMRIQIEQAVLVSLIHIGISKLLFSI